MIQIDEPLPEGALESEVVLHIRLHLRRAIRRRESSASHALAMLFGFPRSEGSREEWRNAAAARAPLLAGAELAARLRGLASGVVALGHDAHHLVECKAWLWERKRRDDAFEKIVATDLATLLELSKARDLAVAMGQDEQGNPRHLPILIQGGTGTGKELLAKGIHAIWKKESGNPKAPFQVVHVAGMTDDLINDELFGHVKGAYTGADTERLGRIEAAHEGTLLIDEVGDLPQAAQLRLLRFLQSQQMSRVGENKERHVKVRVIAATWHDLEKLVEKGRFRRDLFHRLRFGSSLMLPPLLEREDFFKEVVPLLLQSRGHKATPPLTRSARDALALHQWPGNLRELVGVLEEALSVSEGDTLRVEHLPAHIQRAYLSKPLYDRSIGFLSDELEGQELTEEHVRWRVEQVDRSIKTLEGEIQANPELAQLLKFLSSVGDETPEHQEAMQGVANWIKLDQQQRLQMGLAEVWAQLAAEDVPAVVARVLKDTEAQARGQAKELLRLQHELEPKVMKKLERHPWVMLLGELRKLPLFQQIESEQGGSVGEFLSYMLKLFGSLAPAAVDKIRGEVRKGGFIRRLQGLPEEVSAEPKEEPESEEAAPEDSNGTQKKPGEMSREEWEELVRRYDSQAEAQRDTGYDPKTIGKYLKKFGIPNPWARSSPE